MLSQQMVSSNFFLAMVWSTKNDEGAETWKSPFLRRRPVFEVEVFEYLGLWVSSNFKLSGLN